MTEVSVPTGSFICDPPQEPWETQAHAAGRLHAPARSGFTALNGTKQVL